MAISKIILNGDVQMDVTGDTVDAQYMVSGKTATKADGTKVNGSLTARSSSDLTASGATVTVPAGVYSSQATKSVATATQATPSVSVNTSTGLITATATQTAGYVSAGSKSGTSQLTVQAGKTVTPTESEQTAVAAQRYTTGAVKVAAVSSTYIGSGVTRRDSDDITEDDGIFSIPSGYYEDDATAFLPSAVIEYDSYSVNSSTGRVQANLRTTTSGYATGMYSGQFDLPTQAAKTVTPSTSSQTAVAAGKYTTGAVTVAAMPSGTAGTPTATKGSVSNNSVSVTPSVTNSTGYITGGTKSGTAVTVTASELVSGTKSISENGTGIDVTNYASVDVSVSPAHTATITRSDGQTVSPKVQVNGTGTEYKYNGDTFTFVDGDTLYFFLGSAQYASRIYENGELIYSSPGGYYTYTPPSADISMEFIRQTAQEDSYVYITYDVPVTVNPLSVTTNGVYTAPTGTAYSPVTVTVEGGGGASTDPIVRFLDYDGTIVASYTASEWASVSALPTNPTHSGLTSQGWNWTLAQINSQLADYPDQMVDVGQMYITDDGKTRIYVHMEEGRLQPYLGIAPNGTVVVDWGDNSSTETLTGTSLTTLKNTSQHTYASEGDYVITLSCTSGSFALYGSTSSNYSANILKKTATMSAYTSQVYSNMIQKVELGSGANIGEGAFLMCRSLRTITLPSGLTRIGIKAFESCMSLASITIPAGVTSILMTAFRNCYNIVSISMPNSVTNLGMNVFQNCYCLKNIVIPSGITSIGSSAFSNCRNLNNIKLPYGITEIGTSAFDGCVCFTNVEIPDSVVYISNNAFANCVAINSVRLSSNITSLNGYTFSSCYNLVNITIPDGVTSIGGSEFQSCWSLTDITIPASVTSIGNLAFNYCYSLTSITIPSDVTSIGQNAFANCQCLTSVEMDNNITSIGATAFSNCNGLANITLSSGLTSISANMLSNCYSLTSIAIPSGVTSIGTSAFSGCYGMAEYHFLSPTPPTLGGTNAFNNIPTDCKIYVPAESLEAYQTATNWSTYAGYMVGE